MGIIQVADMHCDTIDKIWLSSVEEQKRISLKQNSLHIDTKKLHQGHYLLQIFAAYVNTGRTENPFECCMEKIDIFFQELEDNSSILGHVKCFEDIKKNSQEGKISAMLSIEDGGVCMGNIRFLRDFYRLGVRMMSLTWNYENELGYPNVLFEDSHNPPEFTPNPAGLKEKAIEFIEEMERLGMIIDVSHLSDGGFFDVVKYTKRPFVASHSNARAVTNHVRNLTDPMIRLLAQRGGVMGINFCSAFLDVKEDEGQCKSSVDNMIKHIHHIADVGGIDCIALGTDYDGIGDNGLELSDCSKIQNLADGLRRSGFSEESIEKIFYKNLLRVLKETLK